MDSVNINFNGSNFVRYWVYKWTNQWLIKGWLYDPLNGDKMKRKMIFEALK